MANADRLIAVFSEAKARPAGPEREALLAEACQGDAELKEQAISLLQAHEGAGDFLKNTPVLSPAAVGTEKPGDKIGHYKLLQQLGEGGCGVVYMAEQAEPVRRKVALKVIKLGMDTKQVVARFEAERQALALMDHPNIAKVFDAGATDTGRPYFVMELVRGIKITDYCDQNRLSTRQQLDLFIQICQAVQHAHQKGIIHRDIKPSNILVAQHDTVAVPKVIDFGIAKATSDQRLTDQTLFTAFEQFMGTPAYMSPEQAQLSGLDIDTRTDIYSLGVLLYELLTGQPPFDPEELMKSGLEAMRQTIREKEPVRPSTRLTQELVAADARGRISKSEMNGASPRRLLQLKERIALVRGDLDWIVMKCLEKDRTRRYETANGLATDLKRHLNNEPVVARPPSRLYRLQKLVRRNKLAFAAASVVAAALVLGAFISTWQAIRATQAERAQRSLRIEAENARTGEAAQRQQATRNAEAEMRQRHLAEASQEQLRVQRAEDLFARGDAAGAVAYLALVLRQNPSNCAIAERLISALSLRNFALPVLEPLKHRGAVRSAVFSSNGEWVLTASEDKTAQVWDARTGQPVGKALQHEDAVLCAGFSPSGLKVVTASADQTARVWDTRTGEPLTPPLQHSNGVVLAANVSLRPGWWLTPPLQHSNGVVCAEFSRDGQRVVTASTDGTARVWDARSGQAITLLVHRAAVTLAQFSPDGKRVLTISKDKAARIWDAATGEPIRSLVQRGSDIRYAQFSPDGMQVVTGCGDGTAQVWNAHTGEPSGRGVKHRSPVYCVQFSPDGGRMITASYDRTARVSDARTGEQLAKPLPHHAELFFAQFSPDGERVVTASNDNTARVWDARTGEPLTEPLRHRDTVFSARFSPDGQRIVTASEDGSALIWDIRRGQAALFKFLTHRGTVLHAAFSPDGSRVVTASGDQTAQIWNASTGQPLGPPLKHDESVSLATFSPDGKRVITIGKGRGAQIWDANTGQPLSGLLDHSGGIAERWSKTVFSPDGALAAAGFSDGKVRVWDTRSGLPAIEPLNHGGSINDVQFGPEGRRILTGSSDGTARIWDARTGQPQVGPLKHGDFISMARFSPDGQRVVTASRNKTAQVWNADTGQALLPPITHAGPVTAAMFSPNGKLIVTASQDGTARVWNAYTGQPLTEPLPHEASVNYAEFSPDSERVVTVSRDLTARLWDARTGQPQIDPLPHNNSIFKAEFSADGRRLLTVSEENIARLWDVPVAPAPAPPWLPQLAEAVAGQRRSNPAIAEYVSCEEVLQWKRQLGEGTDFYTLWAKWFFADRADRTFSSVSTNRNTNRVTERARTFSDKVEIVLGERNLERGLSLRSSADGLSEPAFVGDLACCRAQSKPGGVTYLYFAIAPEFKSEAILNATITVQFFDAAPGEFTVQYDGVDASGQPKPYSYTPEREILTGSQKWKTATFTMSNARFRNSQNGFSDFRLALLTPDFYVRHVMVARKTGD